MWPVVLGVLVLLAYKGEEIFAAVRRAHAQWHLERIVATLPARDRAEFVRRYLKCPQEHIDRLAGIGHAAVSVRDAERNRS